MEWLKTVVIACSMYSRIPLPKVEWSQTRMRYALCFFPLVGAVIGAVQWGVSYLAKASGMGMLLYGCIGAVVPVLITGGIHMDGFLDVVDARGSCQGRERKLEILKDPHAGAFAILYGAVYLILCLGLFSELPFSAFPAMSGIYVITRAASGFSVVSFKKARKDGLVHTFSESSSHPAVVAAMAGWAAAALLWMGYFGGACFGAGVLLVTVSVLYYYRRMADREFGGVTGDLAGYFLQLCELALLVLAVVRFRYCPG